MVLPFALDHINLWLLRDKIDGVEGWTVVDCCIARDESRAQWEQVFATQLQGLPILRVIVTHMHPDHIGLADWLCTRWNAPLWISSTDYHVARVLSGAGDTAGRRRRGGRLLRLARPGRPGGGGQDPRAHQLLRQHGALGARAASCACSTAATVIDRRARLALHQRLRPCARAHLAVLRGAERAAGRRHDAAAHLHQRERVRGRARGEPAAPVPRQHRALQEPAGRRAGPALARQAVHAASTAASSSCRSTTATAWPTCSKPAPRGRTPRPRPCRSCSSARSTCTR